MATREETTDKRDDPLGHDGGVRPHVLAVSVAFVIVQALMVVLTEYYLLGAYVLAEALDLLVLPPGSTSYSFIIQGRVFQGQPPGWYGAIVRVIPYIAILIIPPVTALIVYARRRPWLPPQDGNTYCGTCGYILRGLREPRCSECGEAFINRRSRRAWILRGVPAYVVYALLCLVTIAFLNAAELPGGLWGTAVIIGVVLLLPLWVSLYLYGVLMRSVAWRDGRTRCGGCSRILGNVATPQCGACGHPI